MARLEPRRRRVSLSRTGSGCPATRIVWKSSPGEGGTAAGIQPGFGNPRTGRMVLAGCNPALTGIVVRMLCLLTKLEPHRLRVSRDRDSVEILARTGWYSRDVTRP